MYLTQSIRCYTWECLSLYVQACMSPRRICASEDKNIFFWTSTHNLHFSMSVQLLWIRHISAATASCINNSEPPDNMCPHRWVCCDMEFMGWSMNLNIASSTRVFGINPERPDYRWDIILPGWCTVYRSDMQTNKQPAQGAQYGFLACAIVNTFT